MSAASGPLAVKEDADALPFNYRARLRMPNPFAGIREDHVATVAGRVRPSPYGLDAALTLARAKLSSYVASGWTISSLLVTEHNCQDA